MRALILCVLVACKGGSSSPPPPPSPSPTPVVAATSSTTVRVDRRIELMSILHRLIEHPAYTSAPPTQYVQDVDRTFGPFKDHPAVAATIALRNSNSITWEAPLSLAVHLDDQLQLVNAAELPKIDSRFERLDLTSYVAMLRDFARDTKLDDFLASHRTYINAVESVARTMIEKENAVTWFDAFFGAKAKARYILVPGLLTGTHNMGVSATLPDGTQELYQVLGIHAADGMPSTDDATFALLVHEMAHSYVNPLTAAHRAELEPAGDKLFAIAAVGMYSQGYGEWKIFVDECIVRAIVVLYLRDRRGEAAAAEEIRQQEQLGFRWTAQLVERISSHHGDQLIPELLKTFDELASASASSER